MENKCSIVAVLAALVFLSSSSTWSGQRVQSQVIANPSTFDNFFKSLEELKEICENAHDAFEVLDKLGILDRAHELISRPGAGVVTRDGSKIKIPVVIPQRQQEFTALVSISSRFTWFVNYNPTLSSSNDECCQQQCVLMNNRFEQCSGTRLSTDQFEINNVPLRITYGWSNTGNGGQTTGVVSLSRSEFSLNRPIFSYRISNSNGYFYFSSTNGNFQSTSLVPGPLPNYNQHLYYVRLSGVNPVITQTTTVIIDTILPEILLEERLYDAVRKYLVNMKGLPMNTNNQLLCYDSNKPDWPDLTLIFPSARPSSAAYAQMVLTKENYVISDPNSNTECAAILPTRSLSVLGTRAQLDRDMIFNVQQSTLQFSQYSGSTASGETGQSGLYSKTYPSGYAVQTKPGISVNLVVPILFSCSWARWFRLT